MKNIAIVRSKTFNYYGDDYYSNDEEIIKHVTEFVEVSDEDYDLIVNNIALLNCKSGENYHVLEKLSNSQVLDTVSAIKAEIEKIKKEIEVREAKEKKAREEKAEKAKLRKLLKDQKGAKSEQELLIALMKKHGASEAAISEIKKA